MNAPRRKSRSKIKYPFSYFSPETGSCELLFVFLKASKQNDVETQALQAKRKFHTVLNFVLFSKVRKFEKAGRAELWERVIRRDDQKACKPGIERREERMTRRKCENKYRTKIWDFTVTLKILISIFVILLNDKLLRSSLLARFCNVFFLPVQRLKFVVSQIFLFRPAKKLFAVKAERVG